MGMATNKHTRAQSTARGEIVFIDLRLFVFFAAIPAFSFHQTNSSITSPWSGRPTAVSSVVPMPSRSRIVRPRSAGVSGRSAGCSPRGVAGADDTALPARRRRRAGPSSSAFQWSRPALSLIFGVRPNSPTATTSVSSSRPRSSQVVEQGRQRLVEHPGVAVLHDLEVAVVHVPAAVAGVLAGSTCELQLTCTKRTPASTSRRAIRQHWPKRCGPYASRERLRLALEVEDLPGAPARSSSESACW